MGEKREYNRKRTCLYNTEKGDEQKEKVEPTGYMK